MELYIGFRSRIHFVIALEMEEEEEEEDDDDDDDDDAASGREESESHGP